MPTRRATKVELLDSLMRGAFRAFVFPAAGGHGAPAFSPSSVGNTMSAGRFLALCVVAMLSATVVAAPQDEGTTPDRLTILHTDGDGRYAVLVTLDDHAPLSFLVDTGAQASSLSRRAAGWMNLQPGLDTTIIGANGSEASRSTTTQSFRSDVFERQSESMQLIPDETEADEDGILGMNLFTEGRLEFDFAKQVLMFGPSRPSPTGFAVQKGDIRKNSFMVVDVLVDGVQARAVIDTGGTFVMGNPRLLAALGFKVGDARLEPVEPIHDVNMQRTPTQTLATMVGELKMGAIRFPNPQIRFADLPIFHTLELDDTPALIIGVDLLSHLDAMAIDYPREELQMRQ
jgi:predicted aspartyl protease